MKKYKECMEFMVYKTFDSKMTPGKICHNLVAQFRDQEDAKNYVESKQSDGYVYEIFKNEVIE